MIRCGFARVAAGCCHFVRIGCMSMIFPLFARVLFGVCLDCVRFSRAARPKPRTDRVLFALEARRKGAPQARQLPGFS